MQELLKKLLGAEEKAAEFKRISRNQFRAIYAHLKSLESISNDERLQAELKLFLARLYYKTKRSGPSKLDEGIYKFFKDELNKGATTVAAYNAIFIKYLEAILAYSY